MKSSHRTEHVLIPNAAQIVLPVIRVTQYDWVSSWAISVFAGMLVTCGLVVLVWVSTREPKPIESVPVELVDMPGGFEDGSPDETLRVDSPEPEVRDAVPSDPVDGPTEIAESVESVVEMSDVAVQQVQQTFDHGIQNSGHVGSAKGTGRRALGSGTGTGGFPPEQRWFVKFGEKTSLQEYAKQLEFFGIELGALLPDGRLAYLTKLTADVPQVRYVKSGSSENRLYMTWQGGDRRDADVQLFAKANVELRSDTVIFHFYSKATEAKLQQMEVAYRNRPLRQIRRTYFFVEPDAGKYKFSIYRQIYSQ